METAAHPLRDVPKVVIVGAGKVGSTTAYALMTNGTAGEIVLIDADAERAVGEAMDIAHGLPYGGPSYVRAGDYPDCEGADIVMISAGAAQGPGETRLDLVRKNADILREIVPRITAHNRECVLLMVTNPVDILTYAMWKISGFPSHRVIGSGTSLDTARFRYRLGQYFGVNPRSVHAVIIGEHGDTEVPVWSLANIAGMRLADFCRATGRCYDERELNAIFLEVRDAAYEIIRRKGATHYAIASAVDAIIGTILRDQRTVVTVSSLMQGQYGVTEMCLSLPTVLGREGVVRVLELSLSDEERDGFRRSADTLREVAAGLGL
ncbi:MAG: L-lactate dehydrogenase [Armatimonadetes bacterium]|nr:L-lactate dehydrogenase [Armatimonadota bacterium]